MRRVTLVVSLAVLMAAWPHAQRADPRLTAFISSIRAIDDHAHVVAPDLERDQDYDALPCDALPASSALPPLNMRFGPQTLAAWRGLYGFAGRGAEDAQVKGARAAQDVVRRRQGAGYFAWVLDQAGIDTVLANRVRMAGELAGPRFRWVPYDDALLFPLDNSGEKQRTADRRVFYEGEERLLQQYLKDGPVSALPSTLDHYLEFVSWTLQHQKSAGAVAIKFEAAYLRALDFGAADRALAEQTFARYASGGTPDPAGYRALQDFLFRAVAGEAGRLGLVVQIHTGIGCGDAFDVRGSEPALLTSTLTDPTLQKTSFVLLHGGSPYERSISALITHSNTYVDMSLLEYLWSPSELARVLRPWLETMPEHVLFGTDAGPSGPGMGWEETTWIGSRQGRQGLSLALTQMVADGVVTAEQARSIAQGVLRGNAAALYHLGS